MGASLPAYDRREKTVVKGKILQLTALVQLGMRLKNTSGTSLLSPRWTSMMQQKERAEIAVGIEPNGNLMNKLTCKPVISAFMLDEYKGVVRPVELNGVSDDVCPEMLQQTWQNPPPLRHPYKKIIAVHVLMHFLGAPVATAQTFSSYRALLVVYDSHFACADRACF